MERYDLKLVAILCVFAIGFLSTLFAGIGYLYGNPIPAELCGLSSVCVGLIGGWLTNDRNGGSPPPAKS